MEVDVKGKALFFKTIAVQEQEYRSDFRTVPDGLTLTEAADTLTKQVFVAAIRSVLAGHARRWSQLAKEALKTYFEARPTPPRTAAPQCAATQVEEVLECSHELETSNPLCR
jgi:hypothetical protein